MRLSIGTEVGRYHILEQLGEGGMAVVYKAYDTHLESEVAIKFIRMEEFGSRHTDKVLKRFQIEAKNMAKLTHPNIVKVMDYGEHEGSPFLVMPYISGGTLKEKPGKPMPWQEAIQIILPIAKALQYAHRQGVIHRDVKPSNILITEAGDPMLSDFGIAKVLESEEGLSLTTTGMGIGTPEYMSPEQAEGKTVDARSDIYSLGIVLYELLTGRKPYIADTPMAVIVKQMHDPLPDPKKYVRNLPKAIEQLLYKALAKEPKERYASIQEFAQALERILSGGHRASEEEREPERIPVVQTEDFTRDETRAPKKIKGMPGWIWAAAGLGVVALIMIVFVIGRGSSTKPASPLLATKEVTPTQAPTPILEPTTTIVPTPSLGIGSTMVSEKDGMILMYVTAGEYKMGGLSDISDYGWGNENPLHTVILDAFWIDRTEVTNAQYRLCVEATGCKKPIKTGSNTRDLYYGENEFNNYPVIYVTWFQAQEYCQWAGRRLPTEAEWEKAERGTDGRRFPWGNDISLHSNMISNNRNSGVHDTAMVGSFSMDKSPYGVFDMGGNVSEWVSDWYDSEYYKNSPDTNPQGPPSGWNRVLRGSLFDNNFWKNNCVRGEDPGYCNPNQSMSNVGFRCAMSAAN